MDELSLNMYQKQAMRTAEIYNDTADKLMNAALGLSGETGEVSDHIKKVIFQGHPLDKIHLLNELGDVLWYIALGAEALGYTLQDVAVYNVAKLQKRYPDGFSVEQSLNREEEQSNGYQQLTLDDCNPQHP